MKYFKLSRFFCTVFGTLSLLSTMTFGMEKTRLGSICEKFASALSKVNNDVEPCGIGEETSKKLKLIYDSIFDSSGQLKEPADVGATPMGLAIPPLNLKIEDFISGKNKMSGFNMK